MTAGRIRLAAIAAALFALNVAPTTAQKSGGVLHVAHRDSPASMSTLEEVTISTVGADDGGAQQSGHLRPARAAEHADSIVPDLADSWAWNADGTD